MKRTLNTILRRIAIAGAVATTLVAATSAIPASAQKKAPAITVTFKHPVPKYQWLVGVVIHAKGAAGDGYKVYFGKTLHAAGHLNANGTVSFDTSVKFHGKKDPQRTVTVELFAPGGPGIVPIATYKVADTK